MGSKSGNYLQNMCRTCMSQLPDVEKDNTIKVKQWINETPFEGKEDVSIMELLQDVQPQIKIQIKDELPKLMCSVCINKLLVTHAFLEMYKDVDKKFRKLLTEIDCNNASYVKTLEDSLEFIDQKDHIASDDEEDVHDLTKFEIEIENINDEDFEKEEENDNTCNWPQLDEETLNEISEENNDYSDASDNEWKTNKTCQKLMSKMTIHKKLKSDYEYNIGTTSDHKFTKISRQTFSKNPEQSNKRNLPPQNADGSIACLECDTVLSNVTLWKQHIKQHCLAVIPKRKYTKKSKKTKKDYECGHCGKVFSKITGYKNHVRTHTGEEPYLCIECGKSFKVLGSLNTHMLRHKGEKTIQCPHCPKKFVCSSGLYGHMMVHTKEKPFVCDICGSAFHMAYQLRKHNLYHNGIKKYQCEYCDMRFVTGEKQRRHMRTHTGEKPYRCKYCDRAFAQSNDCIKHLRQHLGDNVYQCELCPLRFPLARDLRAHFASHKDDDEETRARNLEARMEEERNLQIKLGVQET